MTKEDFVVWRTSEVGREFREALQLQIAETTEELLETGSTPDMDNFRRGVIYALKGILEWQPNEEGLEHDDNRSGTQTTH